MASYRIVCTEQVPVGNPHSHAHIVAVGTGADPSSATDGWTLDQVLAAMDRGDLFYTLGEYSGRRAEVEKYVCALCRRIYIRSRPDAVRDNNLDNLRACAWRRN